MCHNDELSSTMTWFRFRTFKLICRKQPDPSQNFCYSHSLNFHVSGSPALNNQLNSSLRHIIVTNLQFILFKRLPGLSEYTRGGVVYLEVAPSPLPSCTASRRMMSSLVLRLKSSGKNPGNSNWTMNLSLEQLTWKLRIPFCQHISSSDQTSNTESTNSEFLSRKSLKLFFQSIH